MISHTRFINDTCCNWFCIRRSAEKDNLKNLSSAIQTASWSYEISQTQWRSSTSQTKRIGSTLFAKIGKKTKTYNGCANTSCIREYPCMNVVQLFLNWVFSTWQKRVNLPSDIWNMNYVHDGHVASVTSVENLEDLFSKSRSTIKVLISFWPFFVLHFFLGLNSKIKNRIIFVHGVSVSSKSNCVLTLGLSVFFRRLDDVEQENSVQP